MAKSPVMDSFELSDTDDTSAIDELRQMIRRPDWFDVFKKQHEEKQTEKSLKQSFTEKVPDVLLSDTECISESDTERISIPKQRKSRQKRKSSWNTEEQEVMCIWEPTAQKKGKHKTAKKSTKSKRTPPKTRTTRNEDSANHTVEGRRRSNRRCAQRAASQNANPEIVFLNDDDELETSPFDAVSEITVNAANGTSLDDSIEVICETGKKLNGEEVDFENREINILFCWRNKVLTVPMKQDTQFGTISPMLLNTWEVHGAHVMLLYKDKIIKASDTPSDHEMSSGSIVECSVVKSKTSVDVTDPNVITIKLQMKNTRDKKPITVNQMSQFRSIIEKFAKEEGVPISKVTFKFDGDTISHTDTPFSLGIENDFTIDVTY